MSYRCEIAVKSILPAARSLIAKKLVDVYGFSQTVAAKRMGISQPAISQYRKNIRGLGIGDLKENAEFMDAINDITKKVAEGSLPASGMNDEMCRLCRLVQPAA